MVGNAKFLVITGALKTYPPSTSPENAAFIEQNYDKLQALLDQMNGNQK